MWGWMKWVTLPAGHGKKTQNKQNPNKTAICGSDKVLTSLLSIHTKCKMYLKSKHRSICSFCKCNICWIDRGRQKCQGKSQSQVKYGDLGIWTGNNKQIKIIVFAVRNTKMGKDTTKPIIGRSFDLSVFWPTVFLVFHHLRHNIL